MSNFEDFIYGDHVVISINDLAKLIGVYGKYNYSYIDPETGDLHIQSRSDEPFKNSLKGYHRGYFDERYYGTSR